MDQLIFATLVVLFGVFVFFGSFMALSRWIDKKEKEELDK